MANTIALFSSSRRNGNTGQFIDRIASELDIEVVSLDDLRMSAFDYQHRNRDDDFEPLMARVLTYDQIVFATPIYWYSVSAAMKVFLDRLSDYLDVPDLLAEGRRLRGKTAFVACTSIDADPSTAFVQAFRDTFDYLSMRFGGLAHVNCQDGYSPAAHDPQALEFARVIRDGGGAI